MARFEFLCGAEITGIFELGISIGRGFWMVIFFLPSFCSCGRSEGIEMSGWTQAEESNVPNFAQLSERCCNIPAIFQWQCSNVNVAGMLLEHCSENITCECCSNVAGTLQWPHCGLWPFPN
ncbi:hypothetical protein PV328_008448 [Microctonus aethiopoides]|uniref:Uncharacterized protein n=1 Tax=Microctonus aethiopoides TaxID=144406 RepID=A0AA39FJJ1_9HYME|nr:hypothetical protein PV328_008448 [Microctonus aethiopoides]